MVHWLFWRSMKKLIPFLVLCLFTAHSSVGQGVRIGETLAEPAPSAALELDFEDKGFLPPRLTTEQRDAIAAPAEGLVVYNTTTKCLNYRSDNQWLEVCGNCAPQPTTANAGPDQINVSGTSTTLAANSPVAGSGTWSVISGPGGLFNGLSFSTDPQTEFSGEGGETYVLQWTISNACGSSQDQATVSFASPYTPGSQTFTYTGSAQEFVVPTGVSTLTVDARGAAGGTGQLSAATGGAGGRIQCQLEVAPGQVLQLYVGGEGAHHANGALGGWNGGGNGTTTGTTNTCGAYGGGGGGGASDIRTGGTALSNRVIVAGAGGGGGGNGCNAGPIAGGPGGGTTGGFVSSVCFSTENSGRGGTQNAGGITGTTSGMGATCTPQAGTLGQGGNGIIAPNSCAGCTSGGAGGGGYYGGGAASVGSGGGGSSFAGSGTSTVTHAQGFQSGNGQITLSW